MAEVYRYLVRDISKDGQQVFDSTTGQWVSIETWLNQQGDSGYHVVATLDTTQQRRIILETAAQISG